MPSIKCAGNSCLDIGTGQTLCAASLLSTDFRNFGRLFAVVLTAAALGACAQSNVNRTEFRTASRPPSLQNNRTASRVTHRRVAVAPRKHTPFAPDKQAPETQFASTGVASFYSEEQETANGETFDPNKLTAAHPTLPFGTRLRVTNVSTGRSVTVRVNDRGPFIPGRIVDISYSAAQTLGIVDRGIAKVKLDVVQ